jgi:hypothetical protein
LLPKSTVYDYFTKYRDHGMWQQIVDALRAADYAFTAADRDGRRTYVWMTLDQTAVPPHPSPARADRAGAPRPAGRPAATPCPAGPRQRQATPRVAAAAGTSERSCWPK